jgi:hypothetical protein
MEFSESFSEFEWIKWISVLNLSELSESPTAMKQFKPMFVMGRPMLIVDALRKVGKPCVKLHNYYINNYKSGQDIIVSYKDHHFLVSDSFFLISFSDLYDFSNSTRWMSL